jgi:O-antigen ligase
MADTGHEALAPVESHAARTPRARALIWIGVACVLTVGPGAMGYSRGTACAEVLILALVLWSILKKEARGSSLDFLAGAWIVSEIAGTIWTYRTGWGTHSPYPGELYDGGRLGPVHLLCDTIASIGAAFAMMWSSAVDPDSGSRRQFAIPILCASFAVAAICISEQIGNAAWGTQDPRIQATFTNPNLLGAFLCLAIPPALAMAGSSSLSRAARASCLILTGLLAASLVLTQSRGALLGTAVAVIYLAAAAWTHRATGPERARRRASAVGFCAAACLATVACAMWIFPHILHQSRGVSDDQRKTAWSAAEIVIRSQPLTGIGVDGFPAAMAALRLTEMNPDTPSGLPRIPAMHLHAHDLLLQAWVERGIVGAVTICWLVALAARRAWTALVGTGSQSDAVACGAIAAVLATLVQNVTDYTLWYAPIGILFWCAMGVAFAPFPSQTAPTTGRSV